VQGEATVLQPVTRAASHALAARVINQSPGKRIRADYASPAKRFFFTMACTPQLPSTTCVMP
jgi:hypothetical protein